MDLVRLEELRRPTSSTRWFRTPSTGERRKEPSTNSASTSRRLPLMRTKSVCLVTVTATANTSPSVWTFATCKCWRMELTTSWLARNPSTECGVATLKRSMACQFVTPPSTPNLTRPSSTTASSEMPVEWTSAWVILATWCALFTGAARANSTLTSETKQTKKEIVQTNFSI